MEWVMVLGLRLCCAFISRVFAVDQDRSNFCTQHQPGTGTMSHALAIDGWQGGHPDTNGPVTRTVHVRRT